MAEALKRQYDIIVLKTELVDRPPGGDNVRFTLQCKLDGVLRDFIKWQSSTEALGLPDSLSPRSTLGQGPPLTLPPKLLGQLAGFMSDQDNRDRPLWIHLVKPYGALRLIPWEQLLGRALDVPVLMLPDFIFPPPRETKSALEVAVCGSAPLGHEASTVCDAVQQAVELILDRPPRPTRVHVFTDADLASWLVDRWSTSGHGDTVAVHDNLGAAKYDTEDDSSRLLDRPGMIRSPWLSWLGDALRGRSVDVVHFVCHGYLSHDRGAMLFAQSPLERTDRYRCGPVSATELHTFLTRVGAWSTVFTSLPDNYSEPGLRALADEIAQSRPGPLMMHSLRENPAGGALAEGYRFLYGLRPATAPKSPALFIYCQPYRTLDAVLEGHPSQPAARPVMEVARNDSQREMVMLGDSGSPLDPLFETQDNVAPLVASTERFAEQVQLRYQQLARDELLPADLAQRDLGIAHETIAHLREAVAELSLGSGDSQMPVEDTAADEALEEEEEEEDDETGMAHA